MLINCFIYQEVSSRGRYCHLKILPCFVISITVYSMNKSAAALTWLKARLSTKLQTLSQMHLDTGKSLKPLWFHIWATVGTGGFSVSRSKQCGPPARWARGWKYLCLQGSQSGSVHFLLFQLVTPRGWVHTLRHHWPGLSSLLQRHEQDRGAGSLSLVVQSCRIHFIIPIFSFAKLSRCYMKMLQSSEEKSAEIQQRAEAKDF